MAKYKTVDEIIDAYGDMEFSTLGDAMEACYELGKQDAAAEYAEDKPVVYDNPAGDSIEVD